MVGKEYKPTLLYVLKIIFMILLTSVGFLVIQMIPDWLAALFPKDMGQLGYWIALALKIVIALICLLLIVLILLRGRPIVQLSDTVLTYRHIPYKFADISEFRPSRGGSEPSIVTKEGNQIDLELSWLTKKEREEIEAFLKKKIDG